MPLDIGYAKRAPAADHFFIPAMAAGAFNPFP
jgi:hypothetical protein